MNSTNHSDDILLCSFCSKKFSSEIKLIPECGNSICGSCYLELILETYKTHEYTCKKCKQAHILPENGMGANVSLEKMLSLQNEAKSYGDKMSASKTLMEEIQVRIDKLNCYDIDQEADAYCNSLVKQVLNAVDAAQKHVHKMGNELLKQISKYRSGLLEPSPESRPKRIKSSALSIEQELDSLTSDFQHFSAGFSLSNEASFDSLDRSIKEYQTKVDRVEQRIKRETFNDWLMSFRVNEDFFKSFNHLGEMCYEPITMSEFPLVEIPCLNAPPPSIGKVVDSNSKLENHGTAKSNKSTVEPLDLAKVLHKLNHEDKIRQVTFLFDGNLASCSDDKIIKVWEPKSGKMLYELTGALQKIMSIVALSASLLAGSSGWFICLWNLEERRIVRRWRAHDESIISLNVLGDGNLASISFDDKIKVWNPYLDSDIAVKTMHGHGTRDHVDLGVMPNNQLATCSTDQANMNGDDFLRIWSVAKSECIKSFKITARKVSSLAVMKNERVAVGFCCSNIKIFDLINYEKSLVIFHCHFRGVYSLLETANGLLLSGGSWQDATVKVWDPSDGRLVHTIQTGHTFAICSLSLSKDGRYLATGSHDKTVEIFSVNFSA